MVNHKYSVSKTKEIQTRPIAENSTIEADFHVCRVYNENGKNIYNFYIPVLSESDNGWINADIGYGENKGTKSAPRFDLNQYDPHTFTIKVEGRVQRKLTETKGVCICDVHNVYYTFDDSKVYTFYSIVEQSGDEDWIGIDSGYGSNNTFAGSPDFINGSNPDYTIEKTNTIVNRKVAEGSDETADYYVWNIHPKGSQLVVFNVFIKVVNYDWFNKDAGYGNNTTIPEANKSILTDSSIVSSSITNKNVRRVMTSDGKGIGFYDETTFVYHQTGKPIYKAYTLTDGYDFANRDLKTFGEDKFTVNGKQPAEDSRLTLKTSQEETFRPTNEDGTGAGFYTRTDVYISRNNELATTYYNATREYTYGLTDTNTGTNRVGVDGIPNFFFSDQYDSNSFTVTPTNTIVERDGPYKHWYRYDVADKTSAKVIYNVYMPVFEADWMNRDVGYGDNVKTATSDFSGSLSAIDNIMYYSSTGTELVKRVVDENGKGSGYYNPVKVFTRHDNKLVFTWYKPVAIFPWVGKQPSYGDAVTDDVKPYTAGDYNKDLIEVKEGNSIIRNRDESGKGKAVYTQFTITFKPANDVIGSFYKMKLDMPWYMDDVGYGDNIGTGGSPDFILAKPDEFNTTQEPNQVTRQTTINGEAKPYIRFAVTLKEFPTFVCYYYFVRVFGAEQWYRKDIGYGDNIGSYSSPDFTKNLDTHAFYEKDGNQVYRKITPSKGYALYKTVNVYYILDDSIVYTYFIPLTTYDWAFTDSGYGENDIDLTHIGDLDQYNIKSTDEIAKRVMTNEGTGIGWYKVHTITLKADSTELYRYYEPIRTYAFVNTTPNEYYSQEPWKSHNILDDVSNRAYMNELAGTNLVKTTEIVKQEKGDYFIWNLVDTVSGDVIHHFYIHVNDYSWMNTDEGYGTNLVEYTS